MAGNVMSHGILHVFSSAGELLLEDKEHSSKVSSALKEENAHVCLNGERCACEAKLCCHGYELNVLNEWRVTGKVCDVILCADEEEFPCHRAVLAANSLYFRLLLLGDFRERLEDKVMKLAEDYFLTELSEHVKKFAFENLPAIFVTSDFAQGSLRDDQNVLKLLKQAMSVARDRCSCLQ
ncbi:kelch-like protein 24 isoform X2 [Branchiostoma lanceolatum]|uniref:kelch-like protein 24 isoform X2 n=1 Tax=Branchiostoma lanceolatum TaxID=7740 RepID=UPI0034565855